MKNHIISFISTLVFFTISLSVLKAQQIDYKGFPEWSWQKQGITEYYLYTPAKIEAGKKYPIAIFLHGCCGQDERAARDRRGQDPGRGAGLFLANDRALRDDDHSVHWEQGHQPHKSLQMLDCIQSFCRVHSRHHPKHDRQDPIHGENVAVAQGG